MGKQTTRKSTGGFLRRFLLIPIALILAFLYWFAPDLVQMLRNGVDFIRRYFAFSLIPVLTYLFLLGWVTKYRLRLLWHRWSLFLGLGVLVLVASGTLALWDLGGRLGKFILGPEELLMIPRLVILGYIGLLLVFPSFILSVSWWVLKKLKEGVSYPFRVLSHLVEKQREKPEEFQKTPSGSEEAEKAKPEKPIITTKTPSEEKAKPVVRERPEPIITPTGWQLSPLELLSSASEEGWEELKIEEKARRLEEALLSYGVEGKVVGINIGPTVTQFEVEPGWERRFKETRERDKDGNIRIKKVEVSRTRVKVERIQSLANDLALSLAAPSIRIEAPVPGKSVVGIEVPNTSANIVSLGSVMRAQAFQRLRAKTRLALALGKGTGGESVAIDLTAMPHLLIAGATGSGKTVCLNSFISCLLMTNTPDELRLLLIDPKRVELVHYNSVPHLVMSVVVEAEKAAEALRWLEQEMELRYKRFSQTGTRNIQSYNKSAPSPLPYIVLVIDELADLMMTIGGEVESRLCRLAQLARATGIHLIVATQRPSVDVVTGLIKANFPSRISFAVASQVDSRTILDTVGAEKLLGRGDMLFLPQDAARPRRLQGCFISDGEIQKLVAFWAKQRKEPEESKVQVDAQEDPLLSAARRLAIEYKHLSPSFLQRRLQVGYLRAVKLIEALEKEGVIKKQD